jgi:hypothetical protein
MIGIPIISVLVNIALWVILAIMCIKIIFMLFECLLSGPGLGLLR